MSRTWNLSRDRPRPSRKCPPSIRPVAGRCLRRRRRSLLCPAGSFRRNGSPVPPPDAVPSFREHFTGSARTEGYYKISHAEKSAYVAQYTLWATNVENAAPTEKPLPQQVASNRANARRRAQGPEGIDQVQRAVALSKGETVAAELSIKFNQLQMRKKHLRFARSPIHA